MNTIFIKNVRRTLLEINSLLQPVLCICVTIRVTWKICMETCRSRKQTLSGGNTDVLAGLLQR